MRSFQFLLHRHWDRRDPDALIRWSPEIKEDLLWWLDRERLELSVSMELVSPQLDLWSDASDVGWGGASRQPGRFWPLVSSRSSRFHQPAGASSNLLCSPAFSSAGPQHLGGGVLRQHDGFGLSEEPRGVPGRLF